jgi:heptaprenyl diphosphate synthase
VATGLPLDIPALHGDLKRVETALMRSVVTDDPFLTEVAQSLIVAGGKRLRPVLSLASSYVCGAASEAVVDGAIAVELIHLGSLYHDDVMDEAETRRGVVTANTRYGNFVAIVAGDFCMAVSAQIAARLGTEVSALLGATIGRLCEGQVGELQYLFSPDRTEENYFRTIDGKTASLMSAACRVGALTSELAPVEIEALTTYGRRIGMVFQIADDVLDICATDEQLGKPAGNDLLEGVYTLPVLRALQDSLVADELRSALDARVTRANLDQVRKLIRTSTGVEAAVAEGRRFATEAADAVAPLSNPSITAQLAQVGHRLLDRLPV